MNVITANSLKDGLVVFQTAGGWTLDIDKAEVLETKEAVEAALQRGAKDVAANRVVEPYAIEVRREGARLVPARLRERIRAERPDDRKFQEARRRRDMRRGGLRQGPRQTMYRYDEFDHAFVKERVAQFRDQVGRRLSGELDEEQFKPLRLQNGVYLQLHAYMLRIAVPYGTLNSRQVRMLAHIARTYDKGYGHFTTRQNLQFNWPQLKDVPDILGKLA